MFQLLLCSILLSCGDAYPGEAPEPIDHGKFHFSAPAVSFLTGHRCSINYMLMVEQLIRQNPGQESIKFDGNCYVTVVGIKGTERHSGCFATDDKCRIAGFLEVK